MKMMKQLLLMVAFAVSINCVAQNAVKEDTAYVNQLLQQSKKLVSEDPKKAIALAEQGMEVAKRIHFPIGEAYALKNIGIVYYLQAKYVEAVDYWNQSLKIFEKEKDNVGVANLLNNLAAVYLDQGDDATALAYSLRSLQVAEKTGDKLRILSALGNVGGIYHNKKDPRALKYLLDALPLSQELGDKETFTIIAGNIGEIYYDKNNDADDSKALVYYKKAIEIDDHSASAAFAHNGIGKIYLRKHNFDEALIHHNRALTISEKLDDKIHRVRSLRGIANVYVEQNNYEEALKFYNEAKKIGEEIHANVELKDLYLEMASAYSKVSDFKNAFVHKTLYANIKDTLYNIETTKKLGKLQFDFDLSKKEGEIKLLTKDKKLSELEVQRQRFARNAMLVGFVLVLIIAFIIYRDYRIKVKTNKILDQQKVQIENLLLNILPAEVTEELQSTGHATPRYYDSVSVMFTDFKGFTTIADKLDPETVVRELTICFEAFDEIIEKHNLEKIKTIGDSYMAAGGVPTPSKDHVCNMVKAGLEILAFMENYNRDRVRGNHAKWDIRIGMHVGPVVAGVVGKKKYAYDIWGSTVNIASRMESNGLPGLVNISADTYELIKNDFRCDYRGKIYAKNVGDVDMYFVKDEIVTPLVSTHDVAQVSGPLNKSDEVEKGQVEKI